MEGNNLHQRDDPYLPPAVEKKKNLHYVLQPDIGFHCDAKSVSKSSAAASLLEYSSWFSGFCTDSAFLVTTTAVPRKQPNTLADVNRDTLKTTTGRQFSVNEAGTKCLGFWLLNELFFLYVTSLLNLWKKKIFLMRRLSHAVNGAGPKLIQTFNAAQLTPFSWREKKFTCISDTTFPRGRTPKQCSMICGSPFHLDKEVFHHCMKTLHKTGQSMP